MFKVVPLRKWDISRQQVTVTTQLIASGKNVVDLLTL